MKTWDTETIDNVCDLYKGGLCIREVSEITGVPYRTVHSFLIRRGVERRKATTNGMHWTEERRAKQSKTLTGKTRTEEQRRHISEAKLCHYNGLNGYGHTKRHNGGYIQAYCPDHPNAHKDGYVMLHVVMMERSIGRYLNSDETVHHINHNKADNRISNLRLMTKHEHLSMHMKERMKKCRES